MDVPDQLCYIPCNFCSIVLAVSVPYSSLFEVVTVRCGHCSNLWSVNMAAAFQCLQSSFSNRQPQEAAALNVQAPNNSAKQHNYKVDMGTSSKWNNNKMAAQQYATANKPEQRIVNRLNSNFDFGGTFYTYAAPEKRQRVPSAYNQFIKEEIQRIKANNPDMSHREAFSTAAKNWAHFPHIHFGLLLGTDNRA